MATVKCAYCGEDVEQPKAREADSLLEFCNLHCALMYSFENPKEEEVG